MNVSNPTPSAQVSIGDIGDEAFVRKLYAAGIVNVIIDRDDAIVATYGPQSDLGEIIQMSVEMEGGPTRFSISMKLC